MQNTFGRCAIKWFKHDADASIDAKLQELLLDYGAAGYGLYWYCIELIAQGVCENNITFELEHDARIIARNLNLTIQETKDMMKKMIDLNLFSINENNKLACYALAKRLDQSMTSNQGMRNLIANLKSQSHDKVMTESIVSHDKVKTEENRREEIRLEENKIDKEDKKKEVKKTKSDNTKTIDELTSEQLEDLKSKINEYIINIENQVMQQNGEMPPITDYDDFILTCKSKGYKYADFWATYQTWHRGNVAKWIKGKSNGRN